MFQTNTKLLNDNVFWNSVLGPVQTLQTELNLNRAYQRSRSLSLTDALSNVFKIPYDVTSYSSMYLSLITLTSLITDIKTTPRISANYIPISETDTPGNLLKSRIDENLFQEITTYTFSSYEDQGMFNIVFYHCPKGKSFLRNALDNNPDTAKYRLRNAEIALIQSQTHFIRVYRGLRQTENTISIFSDVYSSEMLIKLLTLIPILLPQNLINTTTPDNEQKYHAYTAIFSTIYDYITTHKEDTEENYNTFLNELKQTITTYVSLFKLTELNLNNFTNTLANIYVNSETDKLQRYIKDCDNDINNYSDRLIKKYNEKAQYQRRLNALAPASSDDVKTFIDALTNNKNIEILQTTKSKLIMRVTAPLQYFESSDFERYENNSSSTYNQRFTDQYERAVLHKIFVTREYQINLQGIITMEINSYYDDNIHFTAQKYNVNAFPYTQLPNPHLYHFDCWGPAKTQMAKYLANNQYDMMLLQMIAAVQSVNVAESMSFISGFLNDLRSDAPDNLRQLATIQLTNTEGQIVTMSYEDAIKYEAQLNTTSKPQEYTQIVLSNEEINDTENNNLNQTTEGE